MSSGDLQHLRLSRVDDVVIIEITTKSIRDPARAQELGVELQRVAAQGWAKRLIVNFHSVNYLSSTGYAVLVKLANEFQAAGGQIKFCGMDHQLHLGAQILHLDTIVQICESEAEALKSFAAG
jgi:anti-sigma B factor antagonist